MPFNCLAVIIQQSLTVFVQKLQAVAIEGCHPRVCEDNSSLPPLTNFRKRLCTFRALNPHIFLYQLHLSQTCEDLWLNDITVTCLPRTHLYKQNIMCFTERKQQIMRHQRQRFTLRLVTYIILVIIMSVREWDETHLIFQQVNLLQPSCNSCWEVLNKTHSLPPRHKTGAHWLYHVSKAIPYLN